MLTNAFGTYARWVLRHRRLVAGLVLAVTVVLTAASARLRIEVDPDKQVPQGHPYIVTLNDIHRIFGDKNLVVVGLFPHDGNVFTPQFLAKLDEVTDRLSRLPGANPSLVQSIAAPHVRDVHGTVEGVEVRQLMPRVVTSQAEADRVRQLVFDNDAFVGTLVSRDASAAAIQVSFELTPETPDYRSLERRIVRELDAAQDGTFDYRLAGLLILLSELSAYAAKIALVFPIALLVIALMHFDAFRTFQGLVLPILTALLAVLWAVGFMGLFGIPLDPLNMTTPILILAVAAGHAVQVLKRFYEEYEKVHDVDRAIVGCLERVGPVMLGAGTVATLSFWSLVTFQTASIRTFGLFAGWGIVSALLVEMTLIPVVRSMLPAPRLPERAGQERRHVVFDPLVRWAITCASGRRSGVLIGATALVAVLGFFAGRVQVKTSLMSKFRPTDRIRQDDAAINAHFAGTNTLIFLVDGGEPGALENPAIVSAIDALERRMRREPGVGSVFSYVDVLGRLHAALTADDPNAGALPGSSALVAQYLFLHSMSGGGDTLSSILDDQHQFAKVRLLLHEDDTALGARLIADAERTARTMFPPGASLRVTGTLASTAAASEVMVHGKLRNIAQVALMTFVVSALLLHSLLGGFLVTGPLLLTVVANFGVMGMLGVPLDTMTAAISAMSIGIGADYAMYLLFRVREEVRGGRRLDDAVVEAIRTSGKAVLFVASAVAAGYATLVATGFSMHVYLGSLVALAMIVSALSAIVLLPAVVTWMRPAFLTVAPSTVRDVPSASVRTQVVFGQRADEEPVAVDPARPEANA